MAEPIDLTDESGAVVVSIEVLRKLRLDHGTAKQCQHARATVDEDLADLTCRDCGARLNPIAWVVGLARLWTHFRDLRDSSRRERDRLALMRRVKCRACGEMAPIYADNAIEKRRRETRAGRYEEALKRIAILVPEAAGKYAARIASEALAARPADEEALAPLEAVPSPEVEG